MKRTDDVIVGVATVAIVITLGVSIAWVKRADIGQRQRTVSARFRDVGNARVGNAVVIRGVIGGRVQGIELAPAGWVIVRMKVDPEVVMPPDPVVLLGESSLFGEWQAMIAARDALPRDASIRGQIAEANGQRGLLPGASSPGIGKLTAVAGQIASDVATVAGRVEVAFDDRAAREMRGSIRSVSELSNTLATTVRDHANDLDTLSLQLRSAVASAAHAAATMQSLAERVDSTAPANKLQHLLDDVAVGAAELRRATTQVRDLTERFAKSQTRLDSFLANGDSVLVKINGGHGSLGLLVNDASMYRQTDSLLTQLRGLIADVKLNPKRYFSIRLF